MDNRDWPQMRGEKLKPELRFIVVEESAAASMAKDFGMVGSIAMLVAANNTYLGGSWPVDLFAIFCVATAFISRAAPRVHKRHMTFGELGVWVREREAAEELGA